MTAEKKEQIGVWRVARSRHVRSIPCQRNISTSYGEENSRNEDEVDDKDTLHALYEENLATSRKFRENA
jgi:hypothetical protein